MIINNNGSPAPAPSANGASATPSPNPNTLAYYDQLAAQSLMESAAANAPAPAAAAAEPPAVPATPAAASGQEPAPGATPAADANPDPNVQTPPSSAEAAEGRPAAGAEEEIHDPTPEELAVLNEPGQRALKAERAKRKEAKAEVAQLKAKLAELEAKAPPAPSPQPEPPAPNPPSPTAPELPASATPAVPVATPALADCNSFEQVDARALSAAQTEATVTGLQTQLARQGHEAVAAQLAQLGVEKIGGTPVAEAGAEAIGDYLQSALNGAKLTQAQVAPRRRWIGEQNQSWHAASKVMPDLGKPDSEAAKAVSAIVKQNPQLLQYSAWPQIALKLYLGEKAFNAAATPPPAPTKPAVIKPAPETVPAPAVPAAKPAPGASPLSSAAMPKSSRVDELSAKMAKGTATLAEVDEYGRLSVSV